MNRFADIVERVAGTIEPPPVMAKAIGDWATAMYAAHSFVVAAEYIEHLKSLVPFYQEQIDNPVDPKLSDDPSQVPTESQLKEKIDELHNEIMRQVVKLKTSKEKMGLYPGVKPGKWVRVSKKFKVDTTGWRYEQRLKEADPKHVAQANKLFGEIRVEMTMRDLRGDAQAVWQASKSLIRVSIGMKEGFVISIEHELMHWAQSYLNVALWVEGFGRPSKSIRTPDTVQHPSSELKKELVKKGIEPDDFHSLDDVEFYPDLTGEILLFKKLLKKEKTMISIFKSREG